jgi:hypothetical protein
MKVEMDGTEYEKMKKIEALLEKSLADKEELHLQISKLTEEKLDILKSNEKNVTITTVNSVNESIYSYHSPEEIIRRIKHYLNGDRIVRMQQDMTADFHGMLDVFFQRTKHNIEGETTVTRQGLDEHIVILKKELESELEGKILDDLTELKRYQSSEKERRGEVDDLNAIRRTLESEIKQLGDVIDSRDKSLQILDAKNKIIVKESKASEETVVDYYEKVINLKTSIFTRRFKERLLETLTVTDKEHWND